MARVATRLLAIYQAVAFLHVILAYNNNFPFNTEEECRSTKNSLIVHAHDGNEKLAYFAFSNELMLASYGIEVKVLKCKGVSRQLRAELVNSENKKIFVVKQDDVYTEHKLLETVRQKFPLPLVLSLEHEAFSDWPHMIGRKKYCVAVIRKKRLHEKISELVNLAKNNPDIGYGFVISAKQQFHRTDTNNHPSDLSKMLGHDTTRISDAVYCSSAPL